MNVSFYTETDKTIIQLEYNRDVDEIIESMLAPGGFEYAEYMLFQHNGTAAKKCFAIYNDGERECYYEGLPLACEVPGLTIDGSYCEPQTKGRKGDYYYISDPEKLPSWFDASLIMTCDGCCGCGDW